MLERDDLRVVGVLRHELLPDILHVGIVLAGELLGDDLPGTAAAADLLPEDGPGVPQIGDEERAVVHDADEAAGPDGGDVRLGLELARDLGDEGRLGGRERVPDGVLRDAPRAGRGLCARTERSDLSYRPFVGAFVRFVRSFARVDE